MGNPQPRPPALPCRDRELKEGLVSGYPSPLVPRKLPCPPVSVAAETFASAPTLHSSSLSPCSWPGLWLQSYRGLEGIQPRVQVQGQT